ncbi:unnamed protein product [Penicillium nalgiovense]|nr:unnamed protein product [Penicillium nalgiovense]CAG8215604.1 unnamed protein product [Penicillium nalgiovense]CAG8225847.1 unnamed protein product [Penicillium nalgiovense]CAG8937806.1 unnamed protein product [Penicillium nalgiovense]CAG8938011.1 unnamed protein product [Penicillium nalgiovense]
MFLESFPLSLLIPGTRRRSFPATIMPPATAERLLTDLSTQLDMFSRFLKVDLTSIILEGDLVQGESRRATELLATGKNTQCWIQRLQEIHQWTNLALREQDWLQRTGRNEPTPCSGSHRFGTMAAFIQEEGLSDTHNTKKALQHGRRLMRFEREFGHGITLIWLPVLPALRCLSLAEEARTIEMLGSSDFAYVAHRAQLLARLRFNYQCIHGIYLGKLHEESAYIL